MAETIALHTHHTYTNSTLKGTMTPETRTKEGKREKEREREMEN